MAGMGTGSPNWFLCFRERRENWRKRRRHQVLLTGRYRPYRSPRGSVHGSRSSWVSFQYRCTTCGYVGWSNHVDLARRAGIDARRLEFRDQQVEAAREWAATFVPERV